MDLSQYLIQFQTTHNIAHYPPTVQVTNDVCRRILIPYRKIQTDMTILNNPRISPSEQVKLPQGMNNCKLRAGG